MLIDEALPTAGIEARFNTLAEWLKWQQKLHPRAVDLGLDRVKKVLQQLGLAKPFCVVIAVGGTNGKGSTVAYLEAILNAAGYRVGAYTSPHLLRYNERIRVAGREADDAALCRAFACVDAARGDISLSLFEFGTLAALQIFFDEAVDVAILEVGLGGRLDAVNAVDADAALVTTVDIDHTDWLGHDRESIGYEKAGIFRSGRPAVCADPEPPQSLLQHVHEIAACPVLYGRDYDFNNHNTGRWHWRSAARVLNDLPAPRLAGEHQLANAAAALAVLDQLRDCLSVSDKAIRAGIAEAYIPGRFQIIPAAVEWIFDVAHNPQGARILARCLNARPVPGRTLAVIGMLRDKDVGGVADALRNEINDWYPAALGGARGLRGEQLAVRLHRAGIKADTSFTTVRKACRAAFADAVAGDRIIVFGSLQTVSAAMKYGLRGGVPWING